MLNEPQTPFGKRKPPDDRIEVMELLASSYPHEQREPPPLLLVALCLLAFTVMIYLVQSIPLVGVGFMIFGAMAWPILTVNAAMIIMAIDGLVNQRHRLVLVIPVIYFVLYARHATEINSQSDTLLRQARLHNEQVHTSFDPSAERLAVNNGSGYLLRYGLEELYDSDHSRVHKLLNRKLCKDNNSLIEQPGSGASISWISDDLCEVAYPQVADLPLIDVTAESIPTASDFPQPTMLWRMTIKKAGAAPQTVITGRVAYAPWLPLPLAGCAISGGSRWECMIGFLNWSRPIAPGDETDVVAAALSLPRSPPHFERGVEGVLRAVSAARSTALVEQRAALEQLLKAPEAWSWSPASNDLIRTPELFEGRSAELLAALQKAVAAKAAAHEARSLLATLIYKLPKSEFVRIAPDLIALARSPQGQEADLLDNIDVLLSRMTEAGPAALPFLIETVTQQRYGAEQAARALCREGPSVAGAAAPALAALTHSQNSSAARAAAIALLRFGRPELAAPGLASFGNPERIAARIGPSSPATECSL